MQDRIYIQYAKDVVTGKQIAGKWIKLACQRYLDWFDRDDIYFDFEGVDKKLKFAEKFSFDTNTKVKLMPFQQWIMSNIFGWYWSGTDERVIRNVLIMTARKSGKSSFAALICIIHVLLDNQSCPELAFIANASKQAHILFKYTSRLCRSIDPKGKIFHTTRQAIDIPGLDGRIDVLASDTSTLDGLNCSFVQDEAHAARTNEIWDILKTGQGSRKNPLAISITTAGFLVGEEFPLYQTWTRYTSILNGSYDDDSVFAAIYQMDDDDDLSDENNWVKANPGLGVTPSLSYLREQWNTAQTQPAHKTSILTKNFNIWCNSAQSWISDDKIKECMVKIDMNKLVGEDCYMGVDLSSVSDLTAFSVMWPPDSTREYYPDKFIFKSLGYLPEDTIENHYNREQYKAFIKNKELIQIPGNVVDYDVILEDQVNINKAMNLITVAYDAYNSTQWALDAQAKGLYLQPFSQSLFNFNRPTKEFERLLLQDKVIMDESLLTRFCFRNVELKYDFNDNVKPIKANMDKNNKIDIVIAMLQALGAYLADIDNGDPD